jgi:hypothetical protein
VGAGRHAVGCAYYLDDVGHVCVAADGQPTNSYCWATITAHARQQHPAGKEIA